MAGRPNAGVLICATTAMQCGSGSIPAKLTTTNTTWNISKDVFHVSLVMVLGSGSGVQAGPA